MSTEPPQAARGRGRPPAMSGDERRGRILAAAETVFLRQGYHAATMDDLARAACMSKKTVYQGFASKSLMFEALLLERFHTEDLLAATDDLPPAEALTLLLHHMAGTCLTPRHVAMTRLMIAEALQSRDMADALGRLVGNLALDRWLARQVELGHLAAPEAKGAGCRLFFSVCGEPLLNILLGIGEVPPPDELRRRIDSTVLAFLACLAPGAPAATAGDGTTPG